MRLPNQRFRRTGFAVALLAGTAISGFAGWQAGPAFAQTTTEHSAPIDDRRGNVPVELIDDRAGAGDQSDRGGGIESQHLSGKVSG